MVIVEPKGATLLCGLKAILMPSGILSPTDAAIAASLTSICSELHGLTLMMDKVELPGNTLAVLGSTFRSKTCRFFLLNGQGNWVTSRSLAKAHVWCSCHERC